MATYAYLRVSRDTQENGKFHSAILEYSNRNDLCKVSFVEEIAFSKKDWRKRLLGELLEKKCMKGDVVLVPELSRISRSIPQIYDICSYCQSKGVELHFLKQNSIIDKSNDITTKIMLNTLSLCAEIEITYIQERTREALKVRKEQGVRLGRPKGIIGHSTLDKYANEIVELKRNGSTNVFIAKKFGVSSPTVGNWLKHHRDLLEEVV